MSALRLYGVASADPASPGPLPEGVQLVPFRDLAAVVSEVAFVPASAGPAETEAHLSVVTAVTAHRPVLPAPVGVVFQSADVLLRWLELHFVALSDGLGFVEGRVGARVHMRHREAHIIEEARSDMTAVATQSFRQLRRYAVAALPVRGDGNVADLLGGAFLVEQERWQAFADAVAEEEARQGVLQLVATGPWPPFDFVRMQFGG
ncbi:MAG TPA: GvpL/GvpF family gas vesicle protein [Gemmatimonadaceae bacterium]|nr:GvpL/GvpF family gas vesicle protein [Gemmatimonadaceae bacterium]